MDRRLKVIGGMIISALALGAMYYTSNQAEHEWGWGGWSWLVGLAFFIAVSVALGYELERD